MRAHKDRNNLWNSIVVSTFLRSKEDKAMKICMLAYTFYENDNRVRRYAETLVGRGDEVEAVVIGKPGQPVYEVIKGVQVHRIQTRIIDENGPMSYLRKLMRFFFRSAWFITRRHWRAPYDVIHVHSVPDFEVFATLIPRLMGARVILDIHDIVPEFYASKFNLNHTAWLIRFLILIERISVAYADLVIISNHLWQQKLIARSARADKCMVILNHPDPSLFYPRLARKRDPDKFILCYPGTLIWHQGVDLAIEAVARLRKDIPGLELHIIGDGADREKLRKMIHQLQLQDRVFLKGLLSMEDVAEVMAEVDLGVVPKRSDSFGNEAFSTKIPEFMSMGVPVIASRTKIDQHYFNEHIIQFFEAENVDDLAAKIRQLYESEPRRREISRQALEYARSNNWAVNKSQYLMVIDRLVTRVKPLLVDSSCLRP